MSLILEALKKSESRRRLGEAPDLGTPFTVARRRRNWLPLIGVLLVGAGAFGWWYLRTPPTTVDGNTISPGVPRAAAPAAQAPAAAPQRNATAGPATPRAPALPTTASDAPVAPPAARPANAGANRMQPGSVLDGNPSQPAAPGTAAMRAANRSGIPGVVPQVPAAQPAPANRSMAVAPPKPAPAPPVAPVVPPAPAPRVVASGPGAQKADANAAPKAEAGSAAATPNAVPAGPPLPLYYELPYSTRKDIPPIVLSMHVFSPDATTRFVVVDGERKTQGDSLKEGLKLDEIRPDGMVLEFRGQQFFYPRSGH